MARRLRPPALDIGSVIRELRIACELTQGQEELGRRARLSMTYISLVETGKRNPNYFRRWTNPCRHLCELGGVRRTH
jgi:transcriptional regulator with XRE-family HTH domain